MWRTDAIKYSPDGKMLAALIGYNGEIKLYDAQNGDELENFGVPVGNWCFAFSPDNKLLATGSHNGNVRTWDIGDIKQGEGLRLRYDETGFLFGHEALVACIQFSPDGKRLASGSLDKTIRVWDIASGKQLLTIKGDMGQVRSVAFSPDGSMIAAGSLGKAYLWDANTGGRILYFDQRSARKSQTPMVTTLTFSPDGTTLFTGNTSGAIHSWRVDTGEHIMLIG